MAAAENRLLSAEKWLSAAWDMVVGSGDIAVCGGELVVIGGEVAVRTVMAPADVELLNINKLKNYAVFTFFRKFAVGKHKTE